MLNVSTNVYDLSGECTGLCPGFSLQQALRWVGVPHVQACASRRPVAAVDGVVCAEYSGIDKRLANL